MFSLQTATSYILLELPKLYKLYAQKVLHQ